MKDPYRQNNEFTNDQLKQIESIFDQLFDKNKVKIYKNDEDIKFKKIFSILSYFTCLLLILIDINILKEFDFIIVESLKYLSIPIFISVIPFFAGIIIKYTGDKSSFKEDILFNYLMKSFFPIQLIFISILLITNLFV